MAIVYHNNNIAEVINKLELMKVEPGIVEDVKQLQRTSNRIRALVRDAGQMEIHDESTKLWLAELSEVYSEAQNLVDELEYEMVKAQVDDVKRMKFDLNDDGDDNNDDDVDVQLMSVDVVAESCSSTRYTNLSTVVADIIADRIKKIKDRFGEIYNSRQYLRMTSEDGTRRKDSRPKYPLPTSHMMNTSQVFGREEDKKEIVDWLIDDTVSSYFAVISVVGKGGLGKTTVAQLVYNDPEVSEFFDLKIWICVSLEFDIVKLTREMVEFIPGESCNSAQLARLQDVLQATIAKKKVLLVLDDVWDLQRSSWEDFKVPLDNGKQMVRVIVTARNEAVFDVMEGAKLCHLSYLPNDDCWELFKSRAFFGQNSKQFPQLEDIGMRIVRKSSGLPLVVKSLGGILQGSTDEAKWNDVLESKLWDFDGENGVLSILRLSYSYMPTNLKACFLSCTVFPKDYDLEKVELVHLWIALGYIQTISRSLEDVGNDYFDELHKRSFFDLHNNIDKQKRSYKMHDIIHDLALHILHNSNCASSSSSVPNFESIINLWALPCDNFIYYSLFSSLKVNIKLIRFVIFNTVSVIPKDFCRLYNLRVLLIEYSSSNQWLPEEIGNLINLIYIRIKRSYKIRVPKSICQLENLVTLDLSGTKHNVDQLHLPVGFGKLLKLERLHFHTFSSPDELRELKNLENLQGAIWIDNIEYIYDFEASAINLKNKPKIENLMLHWTLHGSQCFLLSKHLHLIVCDNNHNVMKINNTMKKGEDVLESLQPHTNLKSLTIGDYDGDRFSSWLGDPSFSRLVEIHLLECTKVCCLPTLGQLPLLQSLEIVRLSNVKSIGSEFCRNLLDENGLSEDEKAAFPSLLKLRFYKMYKWEEWSGILQDHDFPQLQELMIEDCPNLTMLPSLLINKLNRIICNTARFAHVVGDYKFLNDILRYGKELCIFQLKNINVKEDAEQAKMKSEHHVDILILGFGLRDNLNATQESFRRMSISGLRLEVCFNCSNYILIEADSIRAIDLDQSIQLHTNLCELHIYEYSGVSFPYWLGDPSFVKLTVISISKCDNTNITSLPTLGQLPFLEYLTIKKIRHVKAVRNEFSRFVSYLDDHSMMSNYKVAFPLLGELVFEDMLELEEWCSDFDGDFPLLHYLRITNCPSLVSIPSLPRYISKFCVEECTSLKNLTRDQARDCSPCFNNFLFPCSLDINFRAHYLNKIMLSACANITSLPTLGHLRHLKYLKIEKMLHIKTIGHELYRFSFDLLSNKVAFPSLYELIFTDMPELEEWIGGLHGDFCQLGILEIVNCPRLTKLPTVPLSVLFLKVEECSSLKSLHLAPDNACTSSFLAVSIKNCAKIQVLAGMHNIDHRVPFNVSGCPELQFPPDQNKA